MTMAGTAMPAMRVMPTGAPISVPSCHKIFFFLLQGFFPQNVQPDGLKEERRRKKEVGDGERTEQYRDWVRGLHLISTFERPVKFVFNEE